MEGSNGVGVRFRAAHPEHTTSGKDARPQDVVMMRKSTLQHGIAGPWLGETVKTAGHDDRHQVSAFEDLKVQSNPGKSGRFSARALAFPKTLSPKRRRG